MESKTVAIYTLGCRLNSAESGTILDEFVKRGYQEVLFGKPCSVAIINTCTVTDKADATCRNIIRKAKISSPAAKIIIVGCFSQLESDVVKGMDGVDLVLGVSNKQRIFSYLEQLEESDLKIVDVGAEADFWTASTSESSDKTRAFLKIQDGCNYFCSYCIVPFARGRSRGITSAVAVEEVEKLVRAGYQEVVLTGVNLGDFKNSNKETLAQVVNDILKVKELKRLRLSSIEPNTINDQLLAILQKSSKFMDHFHLPLQSGDDQILKVMRRRYTVAEFKSVVATLKKYFKNCTIGVDVIVGFPGETKEQFENSLNLLKELPVTHFHVFPFSPRKGTKAFELEDNVPTTEKKRRVALLNELGKEKLKALQLNMATQSVKVLFEKKKDSGICYGYTSNYLRVGVKSNSDLQNKIKEIRITNYQNGNLIGELI